MTGDEAVQLFTDLDVLRRGHFRLTSGKHSDTYLQCTLALQQPAVALRLGRALAARVEAEVDGGIDVVASPALGGILAGFVVAAALDRRFVFAERDAERAMSFRRGQRVAERERVLVVEDVVTTGGSVREVVGLVTAAGAVLAGVATLVDRSGGLPPAERLQPPPIALLTVAPQVWTPENCPLCADDAPLDAPGSRHRRTVG